MVVLSISGKATKETFSTKAKATPADRFQSPVCPSFYHVWPEMDELLLGRTTYPYLVLFC